MRFKIFRYRPHSIFNFGRKGTLEGFENLLKDRGWDIQNVTSKKTNKGSDCFMILCSKS